MFTCQSRNCPHHIKINAYKTYLSLLFGTVVMLLIQTLVVNCTTHPSTCSESEPIKFSYKVFLLDKALIYFVMKKIDRCQWKRICFPHQFKDLLFFPWHFVYNELWYPNFSNTNAPINSGNTELPIFQIFFLPRSHFFYQQPTYCAKEEIGLGKYFKFNIFRSV